MATLFTSAPVSAAKGPFTESSVQEHDLGALMVANDGREYRYCKVGATALVPGKLYQAAAEDTSNMQDLTVAAASVGATSMTTSTTVTLAKDALAGGLLVVTSASTGAGQTLKIKGNTAATAAATTIYLEDPVIVATTGTVKVDVKPHVLSGVIVNPATASSAPVGAAVYPVTAAYYGWLQVAGPCALLADGANAVGASLVASNGVAGAVEDVTGTAQSIVGIALSGCADTEYGLVDLKLA